MTSSLMNPKNLRILIFSSILVIIVLIIYNLRTNSDVNHYGQARRTDLIQKVSIPGYIFPKRRSIIASPYDGYVKQVYVKIGDQVKPGDPLVSVSQSLQSTDQVYPIRSPLKGTVVQVEKSEGEFVKQGDLKEYILRIDDLETLYVYAKAPEMDRTKIQLQQEAVIRPSAILNKSYRGILKDLSLASKQNDDWGRSQNVEYPIRVEITDSDEQLKPGLSVVVDIVTAKKENVLMLSHEYVYQTDEKQFVILKNGESRDIKIGLQNEDGVEILEGLTESDFVQAVDFSKFVQDQKK